MAMATKRKIRLKGEEKAHTQDRTQAQALVEADAQELLARAEAGEVLSVQERQRALAYMLLSRGDLWPTALLARFFHADEGEIRRDLQEIKRVLAHIPKDEDLLGELMLLLYTHQAVLDRYLAENLARLRPQDVATLLRERRELISSVVDRLAKLQEW